MISGLFFGFAFGVAGLGAAVLGRVADAYGIYTVYWICAFGVCATLPFTSQVMPLFLEHRGVPRPWLGPTLTLGQSMEIVALALLPVLLLRLGIRSQIRQVHVVITPIQQCLADWGEDTRLIVAEVEPMSYGKCRSSTVQGHPRADS